jgi:hypothetical protein
VTKARLCFLVASLLACDLFVYLSDSAVSKQDDDVTSIGSYVRCSCVRSSAHVLKLKGLLRFVEKLNLYLQTLPLLRETMEATLQLFQDTAVILAAIHSLITAVCPEKKVSKCVTGVKPFVPLVFTICIVLSVESCCRALAKCSSFSASGKESSARSSGSVTRAVMRALLRTPLVEEIHCDLTSILSRCGDVQDADGVATLFAELNLNFDKKAALQQDIRQCFCISAGAGISVRCTLQHLRTLSDI